MQGRPGFFDDLALLPKLDVVDLNDVDVIGLEPFEAFVNRGDYPFGRVVEAGLQIEVVAGYLGGQDDFVPVASQGLTQPGFGQGPAVVGGYVKVVDAVVDGVMDGPGTLGWIDLSKLSA